MKKYLLMAIAAVGLLAATFTLADEVRYEFDEMFPRDVLSRDDFRANLRGLHQMDFAPLRPMAKRYIDEMEYSSDASAAAQYAGTGVTITKQVVSGTLVQEGSYSLKAVTDATANRAFERSLSVNLNVFDSIKLWERSSQASDTIQFYLEDSGSDQSYWDITTSGTVGYWKQDTLDLQTPSSTSGTAADLTDITAYGFRELTASKTYYFDTIKAIVGMGVAIKGTDIGDYYRNVTFLKTPIQVDAKASPAVAAPAANPRIDILTMDSTGTLAWVQGTEAASPAAPWSSVAENVIPIAEVYLKTTMTKVVDYEDQAAFPSDGYIKADVRPFISLNRPPAKGADVASASSMTLGKDGNYFDITGTTGITSITIKPQGIDVIMQFDGTLTVTDGSNLVLDGNFSAYPGSTLHLISNGTNWHEIARTPNVQTFLGLTDTPNSYSSQAGNFVRVNAGASALEFFAAPTGGLLVEGTASFTAATSASITKTISSGDTYLVVFEGASSNDSFEPGIRFNSDSGNDYMVSVKGINHATAFNEGDTTATSSIRLLGTTARNLGDGGFLIKILVTARNSRSEILYDISTFDGNSDGSNDLIQASGAGFYEDATPTSIQLIRVSGTGTITGRSYIMKLKFL